MPCIILRRKVQGTLSAVCWDAVKYLQAIWISSLSRSSGCTATGYVVKAAARKYDLPEYLIARIAFDEVGGDPPSKDDAARLIVGNSVSFGDLGMNIDTAAALGYDPRS